MQKQDPRKFALAGLARRIDPCLQTQISRLEIKHLDICGRVQLLPLLRRRPLPHELGLEIRARLRIILILQIEVRYLLLHGNLHLGLSLGHAGPRSLQRLIEQIADPAAHQHADHHYPADNRQDDPQHLV